jgi:hypothetical protein
MWQLFLAAGIELLHAMLADGRSGHAQPKSHHLYFRVATGAGVM